MLSKYTNLFFPVCSLAISILLFVLFFSKKKLQNSETKIYSKLVSLGLIESGLYTYICLIAHIILKESTIWYFVLLNKVLYIVYILWFTALFYYMINLYKIKNKNIIHKIISIIDIILIILICIFNVEIFYDANTGMSNSSGPASYILFFGASLYVLSMIIFIILNYRKSINKSKYIPYFILLLLMVITLIIRWLDPLLSIYSNVLSFVCLTMYFTIENPDIKMVDELIKNRKVIERNSEEKSMFLFKISQELKQPINNISNEIKKYNNNLTKIEVDELIYNINTNNLKINYLVSDALGINFDDSRNIKILENTYNIYSLIEEVKIRTTKLIEKDIDLNFNYLSNIPNELYGDSIKLKQILNSIIINSIKNTDKGYIHIDINSITKYDICRLIISIKDSGKGMDILTINKIINDNIELKDSDYLKLEKQEIDLTLINRVIKSMKGTMYITSELNKGTEVIITIDQYIKRKEKNSLIESYIEARSNKKKALIINDNPKELKTIKINLEKLGYTTYSSILKKDYLNKINNNKFELILIEDEIYSTNAISILKEIKKLTPKSKIVVLLDNNKISISHHYIEEGFDNYIDKSKLQEEISEKLK